MDQPLPLVHEAAWGRIEPRRAAWGLAWGPSKNKKNAWGRKARGRLLFAAMALGQQANNPLALPSKLLNSWA
jgi:hypothetical protein